MKKKGITIRILCSFFFVTFIILSIIITLEYLFQVLLYQKGSLIEYTRYYLLFMATITWPFLLFFCIVLYFYLKPLQQTINELEEGGHPDETKVILTKKIIMRLPFFLTIINITGFGSGFFLFAHQNNYLSRFFTFEVLSYFIFVIAGASIYSFLQTTINNQILAGPRELLNIHYIDEKTNFRELGLSKKVILMVSLIIIYGSSFMLHKNAIYLKNSILYQNLMESVAKNEMTIDAARANYKKNFYSLDAKKEIVFPYDYRKEIINYNTYFIISALSLLFISFCLAVAFSRELIIQINLQRHTMKKILEGSETLSKKINIIQFDEIGKLTDIINTFMDKFRIILENASHSSDVVSDSSKSLDSNILNASSAIQEMVTSIAQITRNTLHQKTIVDETNAKILRINGNIEKISGNIIEQSNFVEETANAMTEMASSINSVAELTINANNLANSLVNIANTGVMSVEKAIDAIEKIEETSNHVREIVDIMTDISSKTSLLAMNASIEAAHAGEYGKGFTVVANEIKKLSEESDEQANQIILYIKDMNERVKNGVELAGESAKAFRRINEDVLTTTSHINEITNAMKEQRISTNEILSAIGSVLNATQNNKDATFDLKDQSLEIKKLMENLSNVSIQINTATEEQNKSNNEVIDLINRAKEISNINLEVVGRLKSLLNIYNLKSVKV